MAGDDDGTRGHPTTPAQGLRAGFFDRARGHVARVDRFWALASSELPRLAAQPDGRRRASSPTRCDAMVLAAHEGRLRAPVSDLPKGPRFWGVADFLTPSDGTAPTSVNCRHKNGCTPLAAAISAGHTGIAVYLVGQGVSTLQPIFVRGPEGTKRGLPLHMALCLGRLYTAEKLIAAEAIRGTSRSWDRLDGAPGQICETPLHIAAAADDPSMVAQLLHVGASLASQARYPHRQSPADPGPRLADGDTPVHLAARNGYITCLELMLRSGADIPWRGLEGDAEPSNAAGQTALHAAAESGRCDVVRALLRHDFDPTAVDREGQTPLALAERQAAVARAEGDGRAWRAHHQVARALSGDDGLLPRAWRRLSAWAAERAG